MAKQSEKVARPKVTIIPGRGVSQTINYLLEDRDDLEWLVAVGRNKSGEIFFYDTGGDIVEDLGTLEYLKERVTRAHFGDEPERTRAVHRRAARPHVPLPPPERSVRHRGQPRVVVLRGGCLPRLL